MYAKLKRISKVFSALFISIAFAHTLSAQTQIGLDIDGEAANDGSGTSVSMSSDGSRMAIGASKNAGNGSDAGHVRVYELVGGVWAQLGVDIDGEAAADKSGTSVSMSSDGSRVAIGAYQNDGNGSNSGHVRVYELVGGVWTQLGIDIDGEAAADNSGYSVSMSSDGSRVAIGAIGNDGNGSSAGHVRVYEFIGGVWTQLGGDIDGEAVNDGSGYSVSMSSDGSRVAIGTYGNDGNGSQAGHVRVYELVSGAWTQIGLDIDGEAAGDASGRLSMSSDGSRVAIGAKSNDGNGPSAGHVRVYELIGGAWVQLGLDIDGEAAGDYSGGSVSMSSDGSLVAIGAYGSNGNGTLAGHVRIYERIGGVWTQLGVDIDGEAAGDYSGTSVSMSSDGSRVAIGAPTNDGNGNNAGHVRVYDLPAPVLDTQAPIAIAQDISIYLDNNGLASILPIDIDNGSTDNLGIDVYSISDSSFSCTDVGSVQNVILTVIDYTGNSDKDTAQVMVLDTIALSINCVANINVSTAQSASTLTVDFTGINAPTVLSKCTNTALSYYLAGNSIPSVYDFPIGTHTVVITARDSSGNTDSCTSLITVSSLTPTQVGQDIDGEAAIDQSGYRVSMCSDGGRVAIGAKFNDGNGNESGHVRVYELVGGVWTQLGGDIDGEAAGDYSGTSGSMSSDGSRVAIGAYRNDGNSSIAGNVRVYEFIGGVWTQLGLDIDGEVAYDLSGISVSMSSDGSRVAIGAPGNDGNGSGAGHVRVYEFIGGVWTQLGLDIDGEAANDGSGTSVSMSSDGSRVAIGATGNDGNGNSSGHVRVYELVGGVWTQLGLDMDGEAAGDYSGTSVSMSSDGSHVAIGAFLNDGNGTNAGHVRVYEFIGGVWTQLGLDIDGEAAYDESGRSVSMSPDGRRVAIGARNNDGNGSNSGHVRVYELVGGLWMQMGIDIEGEAAGDYSGTSVSMSSDGSRVAIGAERNSGNGSMAGHVRVYDLPVNCSYAIDSIVVVNANLGVYRAYFDTLAGTSWELEYKGIQDSVWRSKTINRSLQKSQKFNITPSFGADVLVRIVAQDSTGTNVGCETAIQVPCKLQNLNIITQIEAFCEGDSVLLRAGYSGGYRTPSFLWSNGATTKRTFANQGEKLVVTVTDLAGCSVTDSIVVPVLNTASAPTAFVLSKNNATTFTGNWTASSLPSGASLIGYRMAYRQANVGASWVTTSLSPNTTATVDFTGSGNGSANYEFTAFARINDNGSVYNTKYACKDRKFYNGSGNKSEETNAGELEGNRISIYPNPTNNKVYVQSQLGAKIQLFDLHGKLLSQKEALSNETAFDLSAYAKGVYLMKITTNDQVIAKQVMKN